ncbi:MAG TPA: hypothetical protein VM101_01300 [Flavitalea sp.]|nr:hypothetical protein [Flavitalea sp.]
MPALNTLWAASGVELVWASSVDVEQINTNEKQRDKYRNLNFTVE